MTAPGWTALDRVERGALLDTHREGVSFEELRERYADADGGPCVDGFVRYCREIHGIELTPQQVEGARALCEARQVLICGGNGVGKDTLAAAWSLFEVYVLGGLALLLGPTDRQVREIVMRREIGRLWRRAGGKLPGERFEMAIRVGGREEGGLLAFTAANPEHVVGNHSASGRVFIGITEAQAIEPEIFEAAQRNQPTRLLAVCNPTTPTAAVYAFSRSRAWRSLRWSCLDHPNVTSGEVKIPGAVTREWVNAMRLEHGTESRFWTVAVEARFPEESESPLFGLARWGEAVDRGQEGAQKVARQEVPATLGVDVSRGGEDETAIAVRRGPVLWRLLRYSEPDTQVNAERIAHEVRRLIHKEQMGVAAVVIDEVGDGGGVFDKFQRLALDLSWREVMGVAQYRPKLVDRQVRALGFKASRRAPQRERFANLRAQVFYHLGVEFEEGRAIIRPGVDADLLADLREELLHHERIHQADDRILVGSKDEIRRSLGRSPDLADAFAMSFLPDLATSGKRRRVQWA